jgi:hypothetical protein
LLIYADVGHCGSCTNASITTHHASPTYAPRTCYSSTLSTSLPSRCL